MSVKSDCIFLKEAKTPCVNKKKKSVIKMVKPSNNCPYVDGQEIEEECQESDCDKSLIDFKMAVNCILTDLQNMFVKVFNEGPGNCSQDNTVKQSMTVFIGPNADLGECKVKIGQKIDLKGKKICLDINSVLMSLEGSEKENILNRIIDQVFDLQPKYVKDRPKFVKEMKKILYEKLMSIDSTVNAKCSQTISVTQDQNVYLIGNIRCKNSTFNLSQEAIVEAYMSCITTPFLDDIMNNIYVKKLYESSIEKDCVYDLILTKPCDGSKRQYRVEILQPATLRGKCDYYNNQLINVSCEQRDCEVSKWSEWSPCIEGEQMRDRKVIKSGDDCPNFIQKRGCITEKRKRKNSDQKIEEERKIILNERKGYEWLYFGPEFMDERQKKIAMIVLFFLLMLYLYAVF